MDTTARAMNSVSYNESPLFGMLRVVIQVDASGFRKRVDPAGKSREIYWILQENTGIITEKWK